MKIGLLELLVGVETPMPPKMINAAAPDGAPPQRINSVEIIISRFSWPWCEPDRYMSVSPEHYFVICSNEMALFLNLNAGITGIKECMGMSPSIIFKTVGREYHILPPELLDELFRHNRPCFRTT